MLTEGESKYDEAEQSKHALLLEEAQLWQSHMEECRRCLTARDQVARRQAAEVEAHLEDQKSSLETEVCPPI